VFLVTSHKLLRKASLLKSVLCLRFDEIKSQAQHAFQKRSFSQQPGS
jgi:hypothetical protein